jgi:membrane fusion protein, multidrug efflux system
MSPPSRLHLADWRHWPHERVIQSTTPESNQRAKNSMKTAQIPAIILALISLSLPACRDTHADQPDLEHRKIVVTSPKAKDVIITQQYVCQIHAQRHINVLALQDGYLQAIKIK